MNSWRQKASWHQRPTRVKHRQKAKPPGEDDPGAAPSSPKGSFMSRSRQQALYGEPADPVPSARLPRLVRPRSEVAAQLGQRINMGKQILGSLPSSIMELSSSADDEKKWRDYNFDLLRAAFTSDAIAREYRGAPLAQARLIWDATSRPDAALNFTMLNTRRRSDRSNSRTQPRPPFFQRLSRPARTGAVGTVIGVFVPLSPVVAFLIVIAARVERDGIAPAGSPGGASGEGEGVEPARAAPSA
jgi:hypothetical protein